MDQHLYELKPGDHFILGAGNLTKDLKIGDQFEDTPIRLVKIWYSKTSLKDGPRIYPKRWWQFWIRKSRLMYEFEYIGWEHWEE